VLSRKAEGRVVRKVKNPTFDELSKWYLSLPQIQAKKSYQRDVYSLRKLASSFAGKHISEIMINQVEAYRQKRLDEQSYRKHLTRPATVNREIECLRHILNLAEQGGKIESVPFKKLKALKEHNVRDRVISHEEFERLIANCLPHTARIVMMAYYTAMRKGEILNLKWDRIDMINGFIRLLPEDTKTDEGRTIPMHPDILDMLKSMPRDISGWVFSVKNGQPVRDIKKSFQTACRLAGIEDFTFHDLRHTAINNWRLQGNDFFRIMAASGHKTINVFKRYNTVSEKELKKLITPPIGTYTPTK
ncbi:MAG: site-specific integrase, partial [Deltaproteobacteria bacterium]|nr:site-specific integrase [Deltaproteobacteria bacterium]